MKRLIAALCLLCAPSLMAQPQRTSKLKPLHFQADKNNLQVLPQRFEYTLLDEDRLRIGDILIDTTEVLFEITPSKTTSDTYQIRFSWPAGLIKEGELAIKNNSGKAIFNAALDKTNVRISPGSIKPELEGIRSERAEFIIDEVESSLVESMKYLPFMTFCIYRESEDTRLYLCSNELYLSSQNGALDIKSRSSSRKNAQIDINGKIVGNQGIIHLNDRSETVAFKALTRSGAFLEIETRKKDVDFKDVVVSEDEESLIITAGGAEPVDEKTIKKISPTDWQIKLPKSRPVLFLKGDGDIPMRQEFYVRGLLPREKFRPFVSGKAPVRTYSSSLSINGIAPEGITLQVPESDKNARLKPGRKNQFTWSISNIPPDTKNRRYLDLSANGSKLSVNYDIYRGLPYGLGLGARHLTPTGLTYGSLEFQIWFENFLGQNSDWARFRWGIAAERQQQLTEKDNSLKTHVTILELAWRAQEGMPLTDKTWGLTLPVQMIQTEAASITAFGAGAFWSAEPHPWLLPIMDWSEIKFNYLIGSTGGDFKLSSAYSLKAMGFWKFKPQWYFRYGAEAVSYKFDPAASKDETQWGLNTGLYIKF